MDTARAQAVFENRYDAGRKLAAQMDEFKGQNVVVLAIPNGGVPVGLEVALAVEADLDLVISRKIPLPLKPEAGFGAVTDDGTVMLNEELVKETGLSELQISYQVNRVRAEIRQRSLLYRKDRPISVLNDKIVLITDDGLASGYTMKAAITSVRRRRPREIVAVIPVASAAALEQVEKVADRVITMVIGSMSKFYVADFYRYWQDVSDSEVVQCLKEWRIRRLGPTIDLLQKDDKKSSSGQSA